MNEQATYNEEDARDLCRTLLNGVKYCHDLGVVHRDLKPDNILLCSTGNGHGVGDGVKLCDFGLARSVRNGLLTQRCGTPYYMAPELLLNIPYGTVRDTQDMKGFAFYGLRVPFCGKPYWGPRSATLTTCTYCTPPRSVSSLIGVWYVPSSKPCGQNNFFFSKLILFSLVVDHMLTSSPSIGHRMPEVLFRTP